MITCNAIQSFFLTVMKPSMLLNDIDHPMMEKNEETKPIHPNKTAPVCSPKQKNPSRVIFMSYQYGKWSTSKASSWWESESEHNIFKEIRMIHGCLISGNVDQIVDCFLWWWIYIQMNPMELTLLTDSFSTNNGEYLSQLLNSVLPPRRKCRSVLSLCTNIQFVLSHRVAHKIPQ